MRPKKHPPPTSYVPYRQLSSRSTEPSHARPRLFAVSSFEPQPQPETVDALLSATVRVVEDERARGETADTKTGQLVGFTGVILAVEASLGSAVFDHGISGGYSYAFVTLFAVSLLALAGAAYVAIRGLLSPQKTLAFRRADVQWLADGDLVLAEAVI
jgi:hypothetical protein